jgi:hypothetical protein
MHVEGKEIVKVIAVPGKLANVVVKQANASRGLLTVAPWQRTVEST